MPKLKPLIYAFFFFYFVGYCTLDKLTNFTEESSYDYDHNKIYTPNYNKNKYVGLQKRSVSQILQTPREEINGKSTEVGSKQLC